MLPVCLLFAQTESACGANCVRSRGLLAGQTHRPLGIDGRIAPALVREEADLIEERIASCGCVGIDELHVDARAPTYTRI